ncbi:RICIN domain-containing protein [Streptomyces sp. NPDC007861]|uniref:RICIN domain-containing protein n=1 Tax=Streptomyces sp. NPDC007861 TaxID=3154893 RepID=UPI0033EFD193
MSNTPRDKDRWLGAAVGRGVWLWRFLGALGVLVTVVSTTAGGGARAVADDGPGDPPQWVWHASSLAPGEIEKDGAVFPKGLDGTRPDQPPPNLSLYLHVQGTLSGASRYDSGYVGTTTDRDYALRRITERFGGNGFLYRVRATPNFVDVAGSLRGFYNRASEHEYAAMGGFRFDQIIDWEEISFGQSQPGESNAAYDADRYRGLRASGGQPQLAGFPSGHAAWSQEPWRQYASCNSATSHARIERTADAPAEQCAPVHRPYDEGLDFWHSVKQAGHVPDRWFTGNGTALQLVNAASGRVAENENAAANGAGITMWDAHRGTWQQWRLERAEHDTYLVVNLASGKVLDGKNSTKDGEAVVQWERDNQPWQRWLLQPADDDLFRLVNAATGMALDLTGDDEGAAVIQRPVSASGTQTWRLRMTDPFNRLTGVPLLLTNKASGKVIDGRDVRADGERVVQWEPNGRPWQEWTLAAAGDGTYVITSVATGKVLDAGNAPGAGMAVEQWDRSDGRPQRWRIELDDKSDAFTLTEVTSGLVIGNDNHTQDGAALTFQPNNPAGHTWQKWTIEPTDPTP